MDNNFGHVWVKILFCLKPRRHAAPLQKPKQSITTNTHTCSIVSSSFIITYDCHQIQLKSFGGLTSLKILAASGISFFNALYSNDFGRSMAFFALAVERCLRGPPRPAARLGFSGCLHLAAYSLPLRRWWLRGVIDGWPTKLTVLNPLHMFRTFWKQKMRIKMVFYDIIFLTNS